MSLTVSEAKEVVSLYESTHTSLLAEVGSLQKQVLAAKKAWNTFVGTASTATIQSQNTTWYNLESSLQTKLTQLRVLNQDYRNALTVLNETLSIPGPDLASSADAYEGPTGPTGKTGTNASTTGATGPQGPTGTFWNVSSSATVGSLYLGTSVTGKAFQATECYIGSLSATSFSSTSCSITGSLSVGTTLSIPLITATSGNISSTYVTTSNIQDITLVKRTAPVYKTIATDSYNYDGSGILTSPYLDVNTLYVSGLCTSTAMVGTVCGIQNYITSIGTLPSLGVSGTSSLASLDVQGLSTGTYSGTFITTSHTAITGLGTLASLTASPTMTSASMNVVGIVTSLALSGTLLTGDQSNVTSIPTQLNVNVGIATSGNVNVSGICTSGSYVGTLLTASQPSITSLGPLSSLYVNSNVKPGILNHDYSGTCGLISTSTTGYNTILLTVDSGTTKYRFGALSTSFIIGNYGAGIQNLTFSTSGSGNVGIGSTTVNVLADLGSTSLALGSLTNSIGYLGNTISGVVVGSGTSSVTPFVAASRSYIGGALPLGLYTNDTQQIGISSSGAVTVTTDLSVAGQSFSTWSYGSVGMSQTWSDMSASRAIGTIYTNSKTKPIQVTVTITAPSTTTNWFSFYVGSVMVDTACTYTTVGTCARVTAIVPSGSTYKVINETGVATVTGFNWYELS